MKKKGFVYRATMGGGFLFLFGYSFGEIAYWKYFKRDRDEEIKTVSKSLSFALLKLIWNYEED